MLGKENREKLWSGGPIPQAAPQNKWVSFLSCPSCSGSALGSFPSGVSPAPATLSGEAHSPSGKWVSVFPPSRDGAREADFQAREVACPGPTYLSDRQSQGQDSKQRQVRVASRAFAAPAPLRALQICSCKDLRAMPTSGQVCLGAAGTRCIGRSPAGSLARSRTTNTSGKAAQHRAWGHGGHPRIS